MVNQDKVGMAATVGRMFGSARRYVKARRSGRRLRTQRQACEQEMSAGYTQLARAAIEANLGTTLPGFAHVVESRRTAEQCSQAGRSRQAELDQATAELDRQAKQHAAAIATAEAAWKDAHAKASAADDRASTIQKQIAQIRAADAQRIAAQQAAASGAAGAAASTPAQTQGPAAQPSVPVGPSIAELELKLAVAAPEAQEANKVAGQAKSALASAREAWHQAKSTCEHAVAAARSAVAESKKASAAADAALAQAMQDFGKQAYEARIHGLAAGSAPSGAAVDAATTMIDDRRSKIAEIDNQLAQQSAEASATRGDAVKAGLIIVGTIVVIVGIIIGICALVGAIKGSGKHAAVKSPSSQVAAAGIAGASQGNSGGAVADAADGSALGPVKVVPIADLSSLPPAGGGGKLLSALDCSPSGASFSDGYDAAWRLGQKKPAGTPLWIVVRNARTNQWDGTGQFAFVDESGLMAKGKLYHFCENGVVDAEPPTWAETMHYKTEWVWMLAIYSREMDKLARAVSNKYRDKLKIPPKAYATADQWLADGESLEVCDNQQEIGGLRIRNGTVSIEDSTLLRSARHEFRQKKDAYEEAFVKSFGYWLESTTQPGREATSSLWETVLDLRYLNKAWQSQKGWWYDTWGELAKAAEKQIPGKIVGVAKKAFGLKSSSMVEKIAAKAVSWATTSPEVVSMDEVCDKAKEKLAEQLALALRGPKTADLDSLIAMLTRWGDARIQELGWPDIDFNKPQREDVRNIGATEGYKTGPAVRAMLDGILRRDFGAHPATCQIKNPQIPPGTIGFQNPVVNLDSDKMRELVKPGGKIQINYTWNGLGMDEMVDGSQIEGFADFKAKFTRLDQSLSETSQQGVEKWSAAMKGADRAKAAGALRLYVKDLQAIVKGDEWKKQAKDGIADKLAEFAMEWAPPQVKPFGFLLKMALNKLVQEQTPNEQLLAVVEEQSLYTAIAIGPNASVKTVFKDRVPDLAALMRLKADIDLPMLEWKLTGVLEDPDKELYAKSRDKFTISAKSATIHVDPFLKLKGAPYEGKCTILGEMPKSFRIGDTFDIGINLEATGKDNGDIIREVAGCVITSSGDPVACEQPTQRGEPVLMAGWLKPINGGVNDSTWVGSAKGTMRIYVLGNTYAVHKKIDLTVSFCNVRMAVYTYEMVPPATPPTMSVVP